MAHLDELNGGGLTLPDGSGRPLRLSPTRKEQIQQLSQTREFGGTELAHPFVKNEVV